MILLWSRGKVDLLVVLYSINVFLTFSLSLLGLCIYWWRARATDSPLGCIVCRCPGWVWSVTSGILAVTTVEKFGEGGWVTVVITSLVIALCLAIHRHYDWVKARLKEVDEIFTAAQLSEAREPAAARSRSANGGVHRSGRAAAAASTRCCGCSACFRTTSAISFSSAPRRSTAQSYGGAEQIESPEDGAGQGARRSTSITATPTDLAATARFLAGDRPGRRAGQARRGDSARVSELRVLHQQARLPQRELGYTAAAQPDRAGLAAKAAPERNADGDPADAALTRLAGMLAVSVRRRRRGWRARRRAWLPGVSACPFTQCHAMSCCAAACVERLPQVRVLDRFAGAGLPAVASSTCGSIVSMPFLTYCESV